MSIDQAETLKSELTDKFVVVANDVPELRRFAGLTGKVKTVNMNGRALVEFDGAADISWYDIDPSFLTVVDAPLPKAKPAEKKAAAKPAAAKKPSGGKSPLEQLRAKGAGAKADTSGEKKLSPLEQLKQQGAAKAKPAASAGDKKLSPLEQLRAQGAGKTEEKPEAEEPVAEEKPPAPEPEPVVEESAAEDAPAPKAPAGDLPTTTDEIIAYLRSQK